MRDRDTPSELASLREESPPYAGATSPTRATREIHETSEIREIHETREIRETRETNASRATRRDARAGEIVTEKRAAGGVGGGLTESTPEDTGDNAPGGTQVHPEEGGDVEGEGVACAPSRRRQCTQALLCVEARRFSVHRPSMPLLTAGTLAARDAPDVTRRTSRSTHLRKHAHTATAQSTLSADVLDKMPLFCFPGVPSQSHYFLLFADFCIFTCYGRIPPLFDFKCNGGSVKASAQEKVETLSKPEEMIEAGHLLQCLTNSRVEEFFTNAGELFLA